jgi:hypothetical protein
MSSFASTAGAIDENMKSYNIPIQSTPFIVKFYKMKWVINESRRNCRRQALDVELHRGK